MKLVLLALTLLISAESFAQGRPRPVNPDRNGDGITDFRTRDGRRVVRIRVGDEDERDDRVMRRRLRMLEEAVADLQAKVYELETTPVVVAQRPLTFCTGKMHPNYAPFESTKEIELAARSEVMSKCASAGLTMWCNESKIKCQTIMQ